MDAELLIKLASDGGVEPLIADLEKMYAILQQIDKVGGNVKEVFSQAGAGRDIQQTTEELRKQQKVLQETNKVAQAKAKAQEMEIGIVEALKQRQKELRQEIQKATSSDQVQKLRTEFEKIKLTMTDQRSETRRLVREQAALQGSYNQIVLENKRLRVEMNKLPINDTSGKLEKLKRKFRENTQELKRFDKELGQNFRNVGNYSSAIEGLLAPLQQLSGGLNIKGGGALGGLGGLGGAAGALGSVARFAGPIGLTLTAVQTLAGSVGDLTAFNTQLRDTQKLTGLVGDELEDLTAELRATSRVFERDFNEVLRANNALTEQFGISNLESQDLINEALLRGVDINNDFLDQLSEYGTFFDEAGFKADALVKTILEGEDKGIFSDKAVDAVKEGVIQLREMEPATKAALDGIGLASDELERSLRDGTKNVGDILAEVATRLDEIEDDSPEVARAVAAIFRGAGEDAGLDFIKSLKDINLTLEETEQATGVLADRQRQQLEVQEKLQKEASKLAGSFSTVGTEMSIITDSISLGLLKGLNGLIKLFSGATRAVEDYRESLKEATASELEGEITSLEEQVTKAKAAQDLYNESLEYTFGSVMPAGFNAVANQSEKVDELTGKLEAARQKLDELNQGRTDSKEATEEEERATISLTKVQTEQLEQYRELVDASRDYKTALSPSEISQLEKALDDVGDQAEETARRIKKAAEAAKDEFANITKLDRTGESADTDSPTQRLLRSVLELVLGDVEDIEDVMQNTLDKYDERINEHAENFKEAEQEKTKAAQEEARQREEIQEAAIDLLSNVVTTGFDVARSNRERELNEIEANYARRIELAEGNTERQKQLEDELDAKRKEIFIKQAKADKREALFQAIIQGAASVARVAYNPVLAAIVGGIVAAQVVAVAARPIPQYYKGIKSSPEGFAMVGEQGRELITEPSGRTYLTNDGPQLAYLPRGTEVKTNTETERLLEQARQIVYQPSVDAQAYERYERGKAQQDTKALAEELYKLMKKDQQSTVDGISKGLVGLLNQIGIHQIEIDERGLGRFYRKGNTRVKNLNQRNKLGGRG